MSKSSKLVLLIISLVTLSCNVPGVYTYSGYNTELELKLNRDQSFSNKVWVNGSFETLHGHWELIGDSIVLRIDNSDVVVYDSDVKFSVLESQYASPDSIYFNIRDLKNEETMLALSLNGNDQNSINITSNNDTISLERITLDEISISSFYGGSFSYKSKSALSNFYKVDFEPLYLLELNPLLYNPDTLYITRGKKMIKASQPEIVLRKKLF